MAQTEDSLLDAAIIRALQLDGRTSVVDLSRSLGVSRHIVAERLRLLTDRDGLRVVAALDPGVAGHHVFTHSMVRVSGAVAPIAQEVASLPNAVFVSIASGERPSHLLVQVRSELCMSYLNTSLHRCYRILLPYIRSVSDSHRRASAGSTRRRRCHRSFRSCPKNRRPLHLSRSSIQPLVSRVINMDWDYCDHGPR